MLTHLIINILTHTIKSSWIIKKNYGCKLVDSKNFRGVTAICGFLICFICLYICSNGVGMS